LLLPDRLRTWLRTPRCTSWPPVGIDVVARPGGERLDHAAHAVGEADLPEPSPVAGEGELPAVGRPGRVLAAPAALGDLADLARGQVHHGHLEATLQARGVGDLAVLLRRVPGGRVVPVAARGQPPH